MSVTATSNPIHGVSGQSLNEFIDQVILLDGLFCCWPMSFSLLASNLPSAWRSSRPRHHAVEAVMLRCGQDQPARFGQGDSLSTDHHIGHTRLGCRTPLSLE